MEVGVYGLIFAPPAPGLAAMWGPAAWAQSQLTPGVSALAAPPPASASCREDRESMSPSVVWQGSAASRICCDGRALRGPSSWNRFRE
jgi:hypothetical protein